MKLYQDENGKNTIDFTGEISFSKSERGLESDLKFNAGCAFVGKKTFFVNHKKTKVSRFIYAAKILWKWI
ncbi:hypothetical protein [Vibrio phage vB_VcM_SY]